jgi:hypothetical protein
MNQEISDRIMGDIKIKQALRDELINIYMMTEGISVYPKYAQVFLCKRNAIPETQKDNYFLLDAKKSSPTYKLADFGQSIIKTLNTPQAKYVAKVDCKLKINVSKNIFEDLNVDYFPVWKPEAPKNYFEGLTTGYLVVFRVYAIEEPIDTSLLEKGRKGRNSVFGLYDSSGNVIEALANIKAPVLKDDEFLIIKQDIIHRLESIGALIEIIH